MTGPAAVLVADDAPSRPRTTVRGGVQPLDRAAIDRTVATAALFLLGLRQFIHSGVTSGVALALVLVPVCAPALRRYRGGRLLGLATLLAVVWGLALSALANPGHTVNPSLRTSFSVELLGVLVGAAVVLWARRSFTIGEIGLRYGFGMLAGAVLLHAQGLDNPWKYTWGIPTAVIALSGANRLRRRSVELLVLLVLAALSGIFDSRSYAATFSLTALLVIWQMRPASLSRRESWAWTTAMMGALSAAVYYLGTTLLVDGYLGSGAQARSIEQIRTSGSLILGGRPELSATIALMRDHFMGFGVGVVANPHDILVAKTGLAGIHYNPNNGYVDNYLFGTGVELHSNFGDLWASWGIPGLVLAIVIGGLLTRGLAERVADRRADALIIFLCCWGLWNLLFSPLYSSAPTLTLTLGLALTARARIVGTRARPRAPAPDAVVPTTVPGSPVHRRAPVEHRNGQPPGPAAPPMTVLLSFPTPRSTTNPYLVQLARELEAESGVSCRFFSWKTALTGQYDVLHLHWPEILVSGRDRPRELLRQSLVLLLVARLRSRHIPVVRTVHNPAAHEALSRRQRILLSMIDRRTSLWIVLNASTRPPGPGPLELIPHGHYREWFADFPRERAVPGRLTHVGLVRRYKGLEDLIHAFTALDRDGDARSLVIAGNPSPPALAEEIRRAVALDDRIVADLRFITDGQLVTAVTLAELVVLPHHDMHNSGTVLAALSLDRPVLVEDNEINRCLAAEVGPGWVFTFQGTLEAGDLTRTLNALRADPAREQPYLGDRDWDDGVRRHVAAYRRALGSEVL